MMYRAINALRRVQRELVRIWGGDARTRTTRVKTVYLPQISSISSLPIRLLAALILISLLILLKPFIHIRFGRLSSNALGLFTLPTEIYMCEVAEGIHPKKALDIFYHYYKHSYGQSLATPTKAKYSVCNEQLGKMVERRLRVNDIARPLDNLVRLLPALGKDFSVIDTLRPQNGIEKGNEYLSKQEDLYGLLDRHPPQLKFTEHEKEESGLLLRSMGVSSGSPFVCFHARDGEWLPKAFARNVSVFGEWHRDDLRNASIANYLPAAEKLVDLGYHAVRVGKFVEEALPTTHPKIIDYSTKYQTDLMDLYLAANCDFFIGQNSGMTGLPLIFRTPIAFVNVYPLRYINYCANEPNIFIPKHFYSESKGRLLTFREQFELGLAVLNVTNDEKVRTTMDRLELKILENTAEEITEVALEMNQRLTSEFEDPPEIKKLRSRFLDVIQSYPSALYLHPSRYEHLKIASSFLKRHPELVS